MIRKLLLAVVLGVVGLRIYRLVSYVLITRVIYNHQPGPCRVLENIDHGSEDIQVLPNGLAFVTSGMRFMEPEGEFFRSSVGRIYLFDFNHPDRAPVPLKFEGKDFDEGSLNPHGLSLWTNKEGTVFVYVVNHVTGSERVDYFRFDEAALTLHHVDKIQHPSMRLMNDLVVVGDRRFYFTNYLHIPHKMELLAQLHWGSVVFYSDEKTLLIDSGLLIPNGVNVSPDRKYLYVSHGSEMDVRVYDRHENNTATLRDKIELHTIMDNLDVDVTTGHIWTGCHPDVRKVAAYLDDPEKESPSQVLKLEMKDGSVTRIREMYANDGSTLSGSTVAVHYKDAMLVGTVYRQLLYCRIAYQ